MTDRSTKIIPDSQAVARCLDPEMLEILGSHGTFVLSELLEMLKGSSVDCIDFTDNLSSMRHSLIKLRWDNMSRLIANFM